MSALVAAILFAVALGFAHMAHRPGYSDRVRNNRMCVAAILGWTGGFILLLV